MSFIDHLHLLLGVAVFGKIVDMGDDVFIDRVREFCSVSAPFSAGTLGLHLGHSLVARTRNTLICRYYHPLDSVRLVKRSERKHHLYGRAVGVRDDEVILSENIGIDLRDNQLFRRVHSPA